jgi:hypothetical protein
VTLATRRSELQGGLDVRQAPVLTSPRGISGSRTVGVGLRAPRPRHPAGQGIGLSCKRRSQTSLLLGPNAAATPDSRGEIRPRAPSPDPHRAASLARKPVFSSRHTIRWAAGGRAGVSTQEGSDSLDSKRNALQKIEAKLDASLEALLNRLSAPPAAPTSDIRQVRAEESVLVQARATYDVLVAERLAQQQALQQELARLAQERSLDLQARSLEIQSSAARVTQRATLISLLIALFALLQVTFAGFQLFGQAEAPFAQARVLAPSSVPVHADPILPNAPPEGAHPKAPADPLVSDPVTVRPQPEVDP